VIRVVIADDEPVVRVGVAAVLRTAGDIEVVAEAADGREAVELVRAHRPDVAVLDIRMPHLDGVDAAAELARIGSATPVLVLTTFADDASIARALGGGAAGFVLKTGDPQELITGVRAVASGAAYLSPLVTRRVLDGLPTTRHAGSAHARVAALTDRERDVLGLIGAGLSNAEIGRRLHVVEGTVKIYVSTILGRLGVRNRVQAAIVAHDAGLIPPDAGGDH
jgi:DNA-binding NarL/FixJ family response regulator